jgi:hypothetical protein
MAYMEDQGECMSGVCTCVYVWIEGVASAHAVRARAIGISVNSLRDAGGSCLSPSGSAGASTPRRRRSEVNIQAFFLYNQKEKNA